MNLVFLRICAGLREAERTSDMTVGVIHQPKRDEHPAAEQGGP